MEQTIVHVARHGQVHNPDGVLYGRQPGYHLSELGRQMADRLGEHFADVPLTLLRCSPLERARETMEPIAARRDVALTRRTAPARRRPRDRSGRTPGAVRTSR